MFEPLRHTAYLFISYYLNHSLLNTYSASTYMYDAPLKFIFSCLVYFKKYGAKCDYNQAVRTCPASGACPTSTVRTCPGYLSAIQQ